MLAAAPIKTIFFTFEGLSIATLGVMVVPSLWPIIVILFGSTSGCLTKTSNALSASCFRSSKVTFPHTLASATVKFGPTPLLSYFNTANPRSERYWDICLNGAILLFT